MRGEGIALMPPSDSSPLDPDPVHEAELVDALVDDLLGGVEPGRAIARLLRRGVRGRVTGLDAMASRVAAARKRWTERGDLNQSVEEFTARLRSILDQERAILAGGGHEDTAFELARLEVLSDSTAGALRSLSSYRFSTESMQADFDRLVEEIRVRTLTVQMGEVAGTMHQATPEELTDIRQMLEAIGRMVQAREQGGSYDFAGFMDRYRHRFPQDPESLDELLEVLSSRVASLDLLLSRLSPQQHDELEELTRTFSEDPGAELEMWIIYEQLRQLSHDLGWDQTRTQAAGPADLPVAARAFDELRRLEQLERALRGRYAGAGLDDIDHEQLSQTLGTTAARDLGRLRSIEGMAERLGLVCLDGERLQVTATGARKLGERALVSAYEELCRRRGLTRKDRGPGLGPWDPRWPGTRARSRRTPVDRRDLELLGAAPVTAGATGLLLDMSGPAESRLAARKAGLALHALVESCLPDHRLFLIGVSDPPCLLEPEDLVVTWSGDDPGGRANWSDALALGHRLVGEVSRAGAGRARLIVLAAGPPPGPEGSGDQEVRHWPPVPAAVAGARGQPADPCRWGVTVDVYLLAEDPALERFAHNIVLRAGGRVRVADRNLAAGLLDDLISDES